jgi:hypothetical protein
MDKESKEDLICDIAGYTDLFNFTSLRRTNTMNLIVIRDILAKA